LYFALGQGSDYVYHGKTEFRGIHTKDILAPSEVQKEEFNIQSISDIYPEYYILRINEFNDLAKSSLDEWIYFLKNEEINNNFKAKGLDEAKEALDVLKLSPKDRAIYERKEENRRFKESLLYTAKKEGLKEGLQKGIEKGKKETQIEIAKNLLRANMEIDLIIKSTNLTKEEIEKVKKDL
jgi:predicted transposase/invertase (TIGR01784 family)